MSKAKRGKKGKINLKIWILIISIIVIGVTFYMIFDIQNKIEKIEPPNTANAEENKVENETNEEEKSFEDNSIQNEVSNIAENVSISNSTNTSNPSSAPATPAITDQKQKAIELVKKEWGKDDTVDYVFEIGRAHV